MVNDLDMEALMKSIKTSEVFLKFFIKLKSRG